jgi:uncharacterized membrane protein
MVRWTDLIGIAGFALVIVSTMLLFPSSAEHTNWKYMLGGTAVWLLGFMSVVGSVFLRFSVSRSAGQGHGGGDPSKNTLRVQARGRPR